jgi:hypothetical protein
MYKTINNNSYWFYISIDNVKRMLPKSNDTTEHIPAQIEMNSQGKASCSEGPKKDRGPPLKSSMGIFIWIIFLCRVCRTLRVDFSNYLN